MIIVDFGCVRKRERIEDYNRPSTPKVLRNAFDLIYKVGLLLERNNEGPLPQKVIGYARNFPIKNTGGGF